MNICKKCGVELDDDLDICPLCGTSVKNHSVSGQVVTEMTTGKSDPRKKHMMQQLLWQITSLLLLSGVIATLAIDLARNSVITWSIYPVSTCLIIFSYASVVAFWRTKIILQLVAGWLISACVLLLVGFTLALDWPLSLALPLLCAVNFITLSLIMIIRGLRVKTLNILAIVFVGIAVLCLIIDAIISLYFQSAINLGWSVIVAACLLPFTAAVLFMYFRLRKNKELQKIFHT